MKSSDPMNTIVRSVAKSFELIASTVSAPSPGMPKNDSSSSEPVKRNGIATTTCVRIGMSALRSTCRSITRPSPAPFARAVRTWSRPTSSTNTVR
jgi:hypothetical protein